MIYSLIYSLTLETHIAHVHKVLHKLRTKQLNIKREKCDFHITTVAFLGYIIHQEGVAMDQNKVQAVQDWPVPYTV